MGIQTASPANALDVGNRVQLDDTMNGTSDGGIRTRYQSGNLAALISGFFASSSFNGYQIALVNNAGTGLSGSFFHDVPSDTSTIQATVKSFRVDNPDDPYDETDLVYASMEGPEAAMYVRGTAELINGAATVRLPRHFEAMAVAQGMTVQLTPGSAASMGLAGRSQESAFVPGARAHGRRRQLLLRVGSEGRAQGLRGLAGRATEVEPAHG